MTNKKCERHSNNLKEKSGGNAPGTTFKDREMVTVKCPKCGHVRQTGSKLGTITCTNCLLKIMRVKNIVEDGDHEIN